MPNWAYLIVTLFYTLGLSIWIGGTLVLGALLAPRLFRVLPRPEAGQIFGSILRTFARVRLVALAAVIGAAAVKFMVWENGAAQSVVRTWMLVRWVAIGVMAFAILYEIFFLEGAIAASRAEEGGPGERFKRLHRRAEMMMKVSLVTALIALFLN